MADDGHDAPLEKEEVAAPDTSVVARLRRIQGALATLRRLRGAAGATVVTAIPLHLLHREIDVLEGRADAVVPLLLAIRRAYGDG